AISRRQTPGSEAARLLGAAALLLGAGGLIANVFPHLPHFTTSPSRGSATWQSVEQCGQRVWTGKWTTLLRRAATPLASRFADARSHHAGSALWIKGLGIVVLDH